MGMKVKGGMYCQSCDKPVAAQKATSRVRNTLAVAATGLIGPASLAASKYNEWHCPACGGPVVTARFAQNHRSPETKSALRAAERADREENSYRECLQIIDKDGLASRFQTSAELQSAYTKVLEIASSSPYLSAELVLRRAGFLQEASPSDPLRNPPTTAVDNASERGRAAALAEIERARRGL